MFTDRHRFTSQLMLPEVKVAAGLFIFLSLLDVILITVFNGGAFTFTLDDPYIHLALAENILMGHYGVNAEEFSAPSSSILWPLLLAPLTALPLTPWFLLLVNSLISLATLMVAAFIVQRIEEESEKEPFSQRAKLVLLLLFILCSNVIGLLFTGMEHSLQVLIALLIFAGLLEHVQTDKTPQYLWLAIILAPLIRYECLALSGAALLYLLVSRLYWQSVLSGLLIIALLAVFSVFLLSINLGYLPDSILAKSSVAASGLTKLAMNVERNLSLVTPKGITLLILMCFFLHCAWFKSVSSKKRVLAFCIALAILGHLLVGRIGWYFRYEIYLWVVALALLLYIWRVPFLPKVSLGEKKFTQALIIFCIFIAGIEHLFAYVSTPIAASNIHHQQAQMRRFIRDYYQQPVAVNDLGLATYENDLYVLDLWGLGSSKARKLRKTADSADWMAELVDAKNIQLVMIYHDAIWFPEVPAGWIKLAELSITGIAITARFPVSFFAVDAEAAERIRPKLQAFSQSLPSGSQLSWTTAP
ncbi:MAG: hypothetical protein HRU20_05255 [Pseudomonadales bacterium]|nr:hypothetical protein [Pseudomonadales bacterium]